MATSNEKARNAASAERRADIVAAARELYEEQGLSKTSVQDITNRMGVARSLFYHYFPDKEAVTSAVLDDYVADFIEATHYWNAQRHPGDIESALSSVVKLMRLGVFEHDAFRRSLASHENAALYIDFVNRVADRVASTSWTPRCATTARCTRYASSTSTRRSTCSSWASSATCERIRTSTTRC